MVISDLHLTASVAADGGHAPFDQSSFAHLIDPLLEERVVTRLVLLGDIFELPPPDRWVSDEFLATAAFELDAIIDRYPRFFRALRDVVTAGWRVDFVAGNHDAALQLAPLQSRICAELGVNGLPSGDDHVEFHPWFIFESGLIYAEHGHQLHDVMTYVGPLMIKWSLAATGGPVGAILESYRRELMRQPTVGWAFRLRLRVSLLVQVVQFTVRSRGSAARRARRRYEAEALPELAARLGLPAELLLELNRPSTRSPVRMVPRLSRKLAAYLGNRMFRRFSRSNSGERSWSRDNYLMDGWRRLADSMSAHDVAVPFYVFGHTHRHRSTSEHGRGTLINAGTWQSRADAKSLGGPFIRIKSAPAEASLFQWDGKQATRLDVARD